MLRIVAGRKLDVIAEFYDAPDGSPKTWISQVT
jgi:hypothetical protein